MLAPDVALEIGGSRAPAVLRGSLTSVRYETALNKSDRVELTFANPELRWLDHPLLRLRKDVVLSLGYVGKLERVFSGEIVARSASFAGDAGPEVTVAAQDALQRLQEGVKARWFAVPIASVGNFPLPDPAVAGIVSLENGLLPSLDPISAALSVILGGAQAVAAIDDPGAMQKVIRKQEKESDFDFLRRIGLENGWEMHVESGAPGAHVLRFFSPFDNLGSDLTLAYGRSLIDFSPRVSEVGQLASVTAFVWVDQLKTEFAVSVGWDWEQMALVLSVRPTFMPTREGPTDFLIKEPVTLLSAPRTILSHLIPRLNQRLTATGTTVGDPRIRPGMVVRIEDVGVEFGGLYRVVSAVHTFGAAGYRTSFELRKEVWFGSIPAPEQGAVPIRLSAPFVG